MAKIDDRIGPELAQFVHRPIAIVPIVSAEAREREMQRRPIADVGNADLASQLEVALPLRIMIGGSQFIPAPAAIFNRRIAALDAGREHESGRRSMAVPLVSDPSPRGWRRGLCVRGITDRAAVDSSDGQAEEQMAGQKASSNRQSERREEAC